MRTVLMALLLGVALSAQTTQPDLTLPIGTARVLVDTFSPAQAIRIVDLPVGTVSACTLFKSLDETLKGQPYVPRHCTFSDDYEGGYSEDWDFIEPGHMYEISVEYQVDWYAKPGDPATTTAFRTKPVTVLHMAFTAPTR